MIDGVVTLQYKLEGESDYRAPNFEFDMGSTETGYVRIFTFALIGESDLTKAAAGNLAIDNLSIKNLDYETVKNTLPNPEYKTNKLDSAKDFDYADTADKNDLLGSKIENGNRGGGCSSSLNGSFAVSTALLLGGLAIAARKLRRK